MTFLAKSGSGGEDIRLAKRWYLRQVTDPSGNSIHYNYAGEKNIESSNPCVSSGWRGDSARNWYTRSLDVTEILWSGNLGLSQGYTLKLAFNYAARSDTQIKGNSPTDCQQPLYGLNNRLTRVTVAAWVNGADWQTLRTYDLEQTTHVFEYTGFPTQQRLLLTGLVQRGKGGAAVLSRYDFGYAVANPNTTLLTRVVNSGRGAVNYSYAYHKISCANSVCPIYDSNDPGNMRHAVVQTATENGLGGAIYTSYYYGPLQPANNSEWGAVANDGGFLGFKEVQITHYALNSTDASTALQWEKLTSVEGSSGADAGRDNPDPRRGKLGRREVWSKNPANSGVLLSVTDYDWRAYWLEGEVYGTTPQRLSYDSGSGRFPATVIQQHAVTETLYVSGQARASNSTVYAYETVYGNPLEVRELAEGVMQRRTSRDYYPNVTVSPVTDWEGRTTNEVTRYIVDRVARARVYGADGSCVSEVRSVYDRWNTPANNYQTAPVKGLLSETTRALVSCSDSAAINTGDAGWQIERFGYDSYGNQTVHHYLAASDGSVDRWTNTDYDGYYHLFAVRVYDAAHPEFAETASYYGVNAVTSGESKPLSDPWAYWGGMAEWCDVNDVCVRQA